MPEALPDAVGASNNSSIFALSLPAELTFAIVVGVVVVLFIASIWSWAVAIEKWFTVSGVRSRAKRLEQTFWAGQPLEDMDGRITDRSAEAFARVFAAGQREWRDSRRGQPGDDVNRQIVDRASAAMDATANRETQRLESGLPTLAIIASTTPFIGLLGTVVGIMRSFHDIASQNATNITAVAPGISEALFATALGLFAAIPALIFYNKFSSDVSALSERMLNFSQEVSIRLSRRLNERKDG
ncbi:MAG: protein TolQ [Alphaproteobacteria bacterium 32-64-14]|nr:MAG: protein TolQ [Alphaproteobacteria bacterium 32-64-14]